MKPDGTSSVDEAFALIDAFLTEYKHRGAFAASETVNILLDIRFALQTVDQPAEELAAV